MKHKLLKLKALLVVLMMAVGFGQAWAEDVTGTITFSNNAVKINAASVTGDDDLENTWQITTVGTTSYTANSAYYQVGSSNNPASSITFTTTLPAEQTITSMSAKFGGFKNTAGTITLKVGDTTIGTGSLNGTSDVTVSNSSQATGTVLTVTVTGIAKGVKVYYISYTYSEGSTPTVHTLTYSATNGSIGGVVYGTSTAVESGASVAEGDKVTLTAQPADGYQFESWSIEGTGSSLSSTSTNPTDFTMGTANATVTANFTATGGTTTYSVTYNANGATSGDVPEDDNDYEENVEVTVLGNTGGLAKTGYDFGGWNTQANGEGTTYAASETFNITGNTTLYAKWTPYTITAQSNNNSYGTVSLQGYVITANPETGYRYASPAYTIDPANSASVVQNGDEFTITPSANTTVTINFEAIPTHTATFSVNGNTTAQDFVEGASITFPEDPDDVSGKKFVGWATDAISGTTDEAPSFVTSATMSTSDVTFYAVFADVTPGIETSTTKTITTSTENIPTGYGTANTFSEYTLEGIKFMIQQMYLNSNKLQWRASGNSNGTGTMYNKDALNKIQSVVLTYNGDNYKNFTLNIGDSENPTSGTSITPSESQDNENVYTYDCSSYNKSYFVLANGTYAGYLSSIAITYLASTPATYANYCTSVVITYSVTYDANGATSGDVPTDETAYSPNATVTVLGNTGSLAKTGFAFGGWNTQADGEGTNYAADATFNITGNTTLYAKWNTKTITGLSYTGTPTKTTYYAGDSFDPTGLTVNASYNDESQEDVTASVLWTPDPLTKGTTSVTGTYMGQTVNITGLTVKEAAGAISITADNPVNVVALGGSGDLALAYENLTISSASDFGIQFYDANDDEIEVPTWIEVTVENVEPSSYKVSYVVLANNVNSARSAYFKVYALDNNSDLAYSNKVTITQAAIPDFIADGVFDFVKAGEADYDYGSGVEKTDNSTTYVTEPKTWTSGNVTMVTARVSGSGYRWWSNDKTLRFYNESTATFSVPDGYAITKIVTTGANFDSADKGELSSDTWTGLSKEVKLTATDKRYVKTITVTYVPIETVTVGTTGYATYASDHNLDFTKTNIKAYIAKAKDDGTGVTFERVYKIPAGTGILLYKDGGAEEAIPVFDPDKEDADNTDGNVFVRGEGVAVASVVGNMYNYILNKVNNVVGFYKAAGNKVAKNRAYIQVESASFAKDFISMPGFDDSTTGVTEVNGSGLMVNGPVYDLQGRRVEKPGKGLYIVNGKKVLKY